MIRVLIVVLVGMLFSCNEAKLELIDRDLLIEKIVIGELPSPEQLPRKLSNGYILTMDSLIVLKKSGKYFQDFYVNAKEEIVEIVVREKTAEDDAFIARVNAELEKTPPLNAVEIDCLDKVNILQEVFERDQSMRRVGGKIDRSVDHKNLEIIVSFLDKCGMPTLDEVDDVQMAGIWAVLQHASPEFQSRYIPLLEESANKGDLKWGVIALMKDRALMYEGKSQIYGSQVRNGKLYDLFEPEYVNQRRAAIDMGPLEEYLERFDVEFTVSQKKK